MESTDNKEFTQHEIELTSLQRTIPGFYSEVLVQNNTTERIVLVLRDNSKLPIDPVNPSGIYGVEAVNILIRRTTKATLTNNNAAVPIKGLSITIPQFMLVNRGFAYVPEIDLCVCTEAASISVVHPKTRSMSYHQLVESATTKMRKTLEETPTWRITINDPEKRYNKLFTAVQDKLIEIPVTDHPGEAAIIIQYSSGDYSDTVTFDLEDLYKDKDGVLYLPKCPVPFVTINRAMALELKENQQQYTKEEVDRILKTKDEKYKKEKELIIKQHEQEISIKETELKTAKAELDSAKEKIKDLQTQLDATYASMKDLAETHQKEAEQKKKELTESTEKWKTYAVYGGVVVGVITLGIKIVEIYKKTSG